MTDDPLAQAALADRAGQMAVRAGVYERAGALFEQAIALYSAEGDTHAAARVSGSLAMVDQMEGRVEEAIRRMEEAYEVISADEPDADLALLLARLGGANWFAGDVERAAERTERALDIAESLHLPEVLVRGWVNKAMIAGPRRPEEARGLYQLALDVALEHELTERASTAYGNLSDLCLQRDRYTDSLGYLEQGLDHARRIGDRRMEWFCLSEMSYALYMLGRWQEALARIAEIPEEQLGSNTLLVSPLNSALEIHLHRGELDLARQLLSRFDEVGKSSDVQSQTGYACGAAAVFLTEGRDREALTTAERAFQARNSLGIANQGVKQGFVHALEAALAQDEREKADELLTIVERLPIGLRPPYLDATAHRFRARLARDAPEADTDYTAAVAGMRKLELPFHLAVVELEHAEWLVTQDRAKEAEQLLTNARDTFERLEATPWLEPTARATGVEQETEAVT